MTADTQPEWIPNIFLEALKRHGLVYPDRTVYFALSDKTNLQIWKTVPECQKPFLKTSEPIRSMWGFPMVDDNELDYGIVELHITHSGEIDRFSIQEYLL